MNLDIDAEDWPEGDWDGLAERAAAAIGKVTPELANTRLEVSIMFTSDEQVHALNKQWREKDKPTNVLSFPMLEREELLALEADGPSDMPPAPLGDIALAFETCEREAEQKARPLADHAAHLIIHGLLHLAGYDHELSSADAEEMEQLEIKALALMGIADPYNGSETA